MLTTVLKKRQKIKMKIASARELMNNYLDKLESETDDDLAEKYEDCRHRIKQNKIHIKRLQKNLVSIMKEINSFKESMPDIKFFKVMKHLDRKTYQEETEMRNHKQKIKLKFKSFISEDKLRNILPSSGQVSIKVNYMNLKYEKEQESQIHAVDPYIRLETCFKTFLFGEMTKLHAGCFLYNKKLLMCNSKEKCLQVYERDGTDCSVIALEYEPMNVTLFDKTRALVATDDNRIQIVNLDSYEDEDYILIFGGYCWTVSAANERICINIGNNKIGIINIDGQVISVIETKYNIRSVCLSTKGTIYWTNFDKYEINTVLPDGRQELFHCSPELSDPRGIAVNENENVYISRYLSNNIRKIASDKSEAHDILTFQDGINCPTSLCHESDTNKLMIVNDRCKSVRIYKL